MVIQVKALKNLASAWHRSVNSSQNYAEEPAVFAYPPAPIIYLGTWSRVVRTRFQDQIPILPLVFSGCCGAPQIFSLALRHLLHQLLGGWAADGWVLLSTAVHQLLAQGWAPSLRAPHILAYCGINAQPPCLKEGQL